MTVFVTGATGYIGQAVCHALYRVGYDVLGLARSDASANWLAERGFEVHRGDLTEPASLVGGVLQSDAVIHAAASDTSRAEVDSAAVEAMLSVLEGTQAPFIYTSGLWVLGDTGGHRADEDAPVAPAEYVAHVPAVEERVLNRSGLRGIVIRPANVYGKGGGLLAQMVKEALERGSVRYVEPGNQQWPFIHVDDLADLYVRALDAPAGTLLHASAGESVPAREVAETASRIAGAKGAVEPWPLEEARRELDSIADALSFSQAISSDRARDLLGWTPKRTSVCDELESGIYFERADASTHAYICETCATQFEPSLDPPKSCPICEDERQYVNWEGQSWTTMERLRAEHRTLIRHVEPGLIGIGTEPGVGIGQRALLVQTPEGNVLWDCIPLLDEGVKEAVEDAGGIDTITISHPHYYSAMVEWSQAFDAPIYLPASAEPWVMRPSSSLTFWENEPPELPGGLRIIQTGGHFESSTVLHWPDGAAGRGALLTGDTIFVAPDRRFVSFMRSFPNRVPLSPAEVRRIGQKTELLEFDRIYGAWFDHVVRGGAKAAVRQSIERYTTRLDGTVV